MNSSYETFVKTLSKEQLERLVLIDREAIAEAFRRYMVVRSIASLQGNTEIIEATAEFEGKTVAEYPSDINYLTWFVTQADRS